MRYKTIEIISRQFGFLTYEQEEGKKLFFHMSEVEGGEVLQVELHMYKPRSFIYVCSQGYIFCKIHHCEVCSMLFINEINVFRVWLRI